MCGGIDDVMNAGVEVFVEGVVIVITDQLLQV